MVQSAGFREVNPALAIYRLHLVNADIIRPRIKRSTAAQIESRMMPVAGENAVLDGAPVEGKAHMRTAVIDSENAALRAEQHNHVSAEVDYLASTFSHFIQRHGADPTGGISANR